MPSTGVPQKCGFVSTFTLVQIRRKRAREKKKKHDTVHRFDHSRLVPVEDGFFPHPFSESSACPVPLDDSLRKLTLQNVVTLPGAGEFPGLCEKSLSPAQWPLRQQIRYVDLFSARSTLARRTSISSSNVRRKLWTTPPSRTPFSPQHLRAHRPNCKSNTYLVQLQDRVSVAVLLIVVLFAVVDCWCGVRQERTGRREASDIAECEHSGSRLSLAVAMGSQRWSSELCSLAAVTKLLLRDARISLDKRLAHLSSVRDSPTARRASCCWRSERPARACVLDSSTLCPKEKILVHQRQRRDASREPSILSPYSPRSCDRLRLLAANVRGRSSTRRLPVCRSCRSRICPSRQSATVRSRRGAIAVDQTSRGLVRSTTVFVTDYAPGPFDPKGALQMAYTTAVHNILSHYNFSMKLSLADIPSQDRSWKYLFFILGRSQDKIGEPKHKTRPGKTFGF